MKRALILILAALVLLGSVGCQPTPTEEFVVNKRDSGAETKLQAGNAADAEARGAQKVPERWDEGW